MTLNEYAAKIVETSRSHGFDVDGDRDFGMTCALIHSEISEALEEYRKGHAQDYIYYRESDGKPEGIAVELADALIRILDTMAKIENINIDAVVQEKMAFNEGRPYMHGKTC